MVTRMLIGYEMGRNCYLADVGLRTNANGKPIEQLEAGKRDLLGSAVLAKCLWIFHHSYRAGGAISQLVGGSNHGYTVLRNPAPVGKSCTNW